MTGLLRVGDSVEWRGSWGKGPPRLAKVTNITLCPPEAANGLRQQPHRNRTDTVEVSAVPWSATEGQGVVVDLSNGYWAYGFQITPPSGDPLETYQVDPPGQRIKFSSVYQSLKTSHQIDPLETVEADYHSIHSGLGEDLKRTVKGVLPSERKRRKLEPTLDDYPDHRQWNINVGNTNAEELVRWLNQYRPDLIAPTVDMEGMWEGEREPSGQAQVINATRKEIEDLLNAYGYEHPAEEAIGVMPVGAGKANSILWSNPYNSPRIDLGPPVSPYKKLELPDGFEQA